MQVKMETRLASRININLRIVSKISEDFQQKFGLVGGKNFETKGFNVSVLGVGMLTKYFFPKGLILELELDGAPFGLSEDIKTRGEVRYCIAAERGQGYRCGVKFVKLNEKHQQAISKFVDKNERRKDTRIQLAE